MLWRNSLMALVTLTTSTADAEEQKASAVPTFECLGLYYNSETERGTCGVQYRHDNEPSWRDALPLVYDPRERQYRGSLVGLEPDTKYLIRLTCGGQSIELSGRTRSERIPIGKTTPSRPKART